ncbi:hypothetical protein BGZ81_002398 [Podila clonocystis]|nr:hypothetical protein BGZ81_002398 [Podila clonocystis]
MTSIDVLPTEILADIFGHEGLGDIARQVCRRWRLIALPLWLRRLVLLPSDPFKDVGLLEYLQNLPEDDRLSIRALDIAARRDFDSGGNVFSSDVADEACLRNVLLIQSLLGHRIIDLAITDTGWAPESLAHILQMNQLTTSRVLHFQLSLFKPESFSLPELSHELIRLCHSHCHTLKTLSFDLAHPMSRNLWATMANCTDLQQFHLSIHRSSEPVLTNILHLVLPRWSALASLHLCQPRFLSPDILRCLYKDLPRPDLLRELHLIFEACQASLYEDEFIEMVAAMPKLQVLDAHLDWSNRMMEQVAARLPDLRELSVTCLGAQFDCRSVRSIVWGEALEKVNMRTSARIWGGFLDAVRKRSRRVKILVYGSMKWGGSIDEWE